ncbi:hypothetical protein GCM10009841_06210 [Microlunatus panaciterrae]
MPAIDLRVGRQLRRTSNRHGSSSRSPAPPIRNATTAPGVQPVSSRLLASGPDRPKEAAEVRARTRPERVRFDAAAREPVMAAPPVAVMTIGGLH